MKLLHLANFHSTNIGNGALIRGLESTFEEDVGKVDWQREAWDDYTFRLQDFDRAFVEKINASDGLIVGGAVTFNGRDYNDRTGTRFELPLELWSSIKKPVVFYGLSYRHWQGQTYHHADKLKRTIETILNAPRMLLSVRNDGTREWLAAMTGIAPEHFPEVPDSAVYVPSAKGEYPEIAKDRHNLVVAFNDEDMAARYPTATAREEVIRGLVQVVEKLADAFPLRIILCPHYLDDYRMLSDFVALIKPKLAHQNIVTTGLNRIEETEHFYGRYRQVDLAISMRVHSMSPCIGLNVPMVPLTTQGRMTDFLERIGLAHHGVDSFAANMPEQLYTKALHALNEGAAVRAEFAQARATMRVQTRAFHQRIQKLLAA